METILLAAFFASCGFMIAGLIAVVRAARSEEIAEAARDVVRKER